MAALASNDGRPIGRMILRVADADGRLVAERRAGNIVLRGGAAIIAALFTGAAGATPIDTIGIGFARDPGDAELVLLTPDPDKKIPPAALLTPLAADSFTVVSDLPDSVQVRVAARFKPTVDIEGVTEAGLLAGDRLYNQVIFEPVTLKTDQDVTLFWQIDFPFGH